MKDNELKDLVIKYLSSRPKNTAEIMTWLRERNTQKSGIEIATMLESDPQVVRIGTVRKKRRGKTKKNRRRECSSFKTTG